MADQSVAGGAVSTTEGVTTAQGLEVTTQPNTATASAGINAETGRPEGLPEGFDSWEDLAKAWDTRDKPAADGEGATTEEAPKDDTKPTKLEDVPEATLTEVKGRLKAAGGIYADARYEKAALEFETLGDVSAETRKAAAEAFGVTEEIVTQFIDTQRQNREMATQLQQGSANATIAEFHAAAGGPEQYTALQQWAAGGGLTKAQTDAYQATLDTNPAAAKVMLSGFVTAWKSSGKGPGPRDVTREGGAADTSSTASQGYASSEEMQADMRNPKYARDPAFRTQVMARIAATKG